MSYRRFTDGKGRQWEVWEVHPSAVERRMNTDATTATAPRERRRHRRFRLTMPPELRSGWLAFQRGANKIRLAPIPSGWVHLSDDELAQLAQRATARSQVDGGTAG